MIANTLAEAKTFVQTFTEFGQDVCLQEFIVESKGRDVRALVVGDKVVGAMRRTAKEGEFRSNIHRGGEGQSVTLDEFSSRSATAGRALTCAVNDRGCQGWVVEPLRDWRGGGPAAGAGELGAVGGLSAGLGLRVWVRANASEGRGTAVPRLRATPLRLC